MSLQEKIMNYYKKIKLSQNRKSLKLPPCYIVTTIVATSRRQSAVSRQHRLRAAELSGITH